MANLFIPAIGDRIRLTQAWKFDLVLESRNVKFGKTFPDAMPEGDPHARWAGDRYTVGRYPNESFMTAPVSLPKGAVLEIDRVYIRGYNKGRLGDNDYDSITFKVVGRKNSRFWVKLKQANRIKFVLESTYAARGKTAALLLGERLTQN